jgi:hypothetical protein
MLNNKEIINFQPPNLLIKRFCEDNQISEIEAKELFEETKKFLVLCALNKEVSYSPSKEIDEMWHQFLLHSKAYHDFCSKVGIFLHHEPSEKSEIEMYARTLKDMEALYGKLNSAYWAPGETSAGHCGHCSSCGSSAH